jgi:hypothetical protein
MELKVDRNEENAYELRFNGIVLAKSGELSEVLTKAQRYAKKFQKRLLISKAAVADWYCGFPQDKDQPPEIFFDPNFKVQASTEVDSSLTYRFVEGPFLNQEDATEAAFKISGQKANVKSG